VETLEILEVFGVTHFYDVATEGQLAELLDMELEAQISQAEQAEKEEEIDI
jgi:hypothetical protein